MSVKLRGPFYQISIGGIRTSSGTADKKEAEEIEAKMRLEKRNAKIWGVKPAKSWKEAVLKYHQVQKDKTSFAGDLQILQWWDQYFGDVTDIRTITAATIADKLEARPGVSLSKRTPQNATANRLVAPVNFIMKRAAGKWEWIDGKAPIVEKYKERKPDARALSLEEWRKLEAELSEHLRLAATFALATGLREAKVFGLRWDQLTLDRAFAYKGNDTKPGNCIPLNATAMAVIETCRNLPVVSKTHVFSYRGRPMKAHPNDTWKKVIAKAGIAHVRWHDLRVTFNSWLRKSGVPKETCKRLVGHTTNEVQDRYTMEEIEWLRPASAIIDGILSTPVGDRKAA